MVEDDKAGVPVTLNPELVTKELDSAKFDVDLGSIVPEETSVLVSVKVMYVSLVVRSKLVAFDVDKVGTLGSRLVNTKKLLWFVHIYYSHVECPAALVKVSVEVEIAVEVSVPYW
jgi:hypothetical protein